MSVTFAVSILALALLQGSLVVLPRADALGRLGRLRSPLWWPVLPGLIVVGTFGLVLVPSSAMDLVVAASIVSPLLALVAALAVVRRPLAAVAGLVVVGAGVVAVLVPGMVGSVSASLVAAAGAMAVGVVLVRLLSGRALVAAVAAMALTDVVLLHFGVGRLSSQLINEAGKAFRGPTFDAASIGDVTTEYPDLLLAAVIGALAASRPHQRRTALLVVGCVIGYDLLMLVTLTIPATPPLLIALLLSELPERAGGVRELARTLSGCVGARRAPARLPVHANV